MEEKFCKCGKELMFKYEVNWGICTECIEICDDDEINERVDEIYYRHKGKDTDNSGWN
jgi:hypothetical protein